MNIDEFLAVALVGAMVIAPGWWFADSLSTDKGYESGITGRAWGFIAMWAASILIVCVAAGVAS